MAGRHRHDSDMGRDARFSKGETTIFALRNCVNAARPCRQCHNPLIINGISKSGMHMPHGSRSMAANPATKIPWV
jgi:hypothetical protein